MLRSVFRTTQFKKDFKALLKKHYDPDKLRQAIDTLMAQDKQLLSTKYRDHQLTGSWKGYREIHIEVTGSSFTAWRSRSCNSCSHAPDRMMICSSDYPITDYLNRSNRLNVVFL